MLLETVWRRQQLVPRSLAPSATGENSPFLLEVGERRLKKSGRNNLSVRVDKLQADSMETWLRLCFDMLLHTELRMAITTMWWIWFRRNKFWHDNQWTDAEVVLWKSEDYIREIDANTALEKSSRLQASIPAQLNHGSTKVWYPLPSGVTKINCDA